MTELLTLNPWPDEVTLVEALGGAGGGILAESLAAGRVGGAGGGILAESLAAGGAGGILEPSPAESSAAGRVGGDRPAELTAEKDCIGISSLGVEVGCEVTTEL